MLFLITSESTISKVSRDSLLQEKKKKKKEIKEQSQTKPEIKDKNTEQKHTYKSYQFLPPP